MISLNIYTCTKVIRDANQLSSSEYPGSSEVPQSTANSYVWQICRTSITGPYDLFLYEIMCNILLIFFDRIYIYHTPVSKMTQVKNMIV